jgi:hypothetical protein
MPKNFTCDICNKCFNTTQHLNQHKNKKKPCKPPPPPAPLPEKINIAKNEIITNSEIINGSRVVFKKRTSSPMKNVQLIYDGSNYYGKSPPKLSSLMKKDQFDYNLTDNDSITTNATDSNANDSITTNNSISSSISVPGLVNIFNTYKNILDENKKLTYDNAVLIRQLNQLKMENLYLKKQNNLTETFIMDYQENHQQNGYIDTDNDVNIILSAITDSNDFI